MFPRLWAPFGNATEVTNLPPLPKSHSGTCNLIDSFGGNWNNYVNLLYVGLKDMNAA